MTTAVGDAIRAWVAKVAADPTYTSALVADQLTALVAKRVTNQSLDTQVVAKTATRDSIRTQRSTAESTLAGYVGSTYTVTAVLTAGSTTATGTFTQPAIAGGWAQSPLRLSPGTTIAAYSATSLTLSKPALFTGSTTFSVKTGSLALQDAYLAELTALTTQLTAELEAAEDGSVVLDAITDGRAALTTANHYLAPRTVLRTKTGDAITTGADQTTGMQTFLDSVANGADAAHPKTAHLWRGVKYRIDGTLTFQGTHRRLDSHGSAIEPGVTGGGTRDHLRVTDGNDVQLLRPKIRGSLPAGAPAFSSTYAGQHGIQILGGVDIVVDRADIDGVQGSGVRIAAGAAEPNRVTVQGIGSVGRCGNHVLAVAVCDNLDWGKTKMGASGRETIAVSPATGVVCAGVILHDFHITDAVTDTAYESMTADSAGRITDLTIDNLTSEALHGPLTADIGTTAATPAGPVIITDNSGAGSLLNTRRSAWQLTKIAGVSFRRNTQGMAAPRGGSAVMYGLKGTTITGTIDVGNNDVTGGITEALIDSVEYPVATAMTIDSPTSLGPYTEGTAVSGGVQFSTADAVGTVTWTHSVPSGGQALPSGISFNAAGLLSVNPGAGTAGTYKHRYTATDSAATPQVAFVDLTFTVVASVANLVISTTSVGPFVLGTDATETLEATGGVPPYIWSMNTGVTLPAGFTLDADGDLHVDGDTITEGSVAKSFKVTDSAGTPDTDTQSITLTRNLPTAATAWPPQDIQGEIGLTMNHGQWKAQGDALWAYLSPAERAVWVGGGARIEAAWYSLEPTAGSYDFSTVTAKVNWCKAKGIRPIIDLGYCPGFYTTQHTYTNCTISNVGGKGRISTTDNDSTGFIGKLNQAKWDGIHVRGPGIAGDTLADTQGMDGTTPYVNLDKAATATGSGVTVTFGWYSGAPYSEDDRHIGPDPSHYPKLARIAAEMAFLYKDARPIFEFWNEANGQFWKPAQRAGWYGAAFRYMYRAIKEVDPTIPVATTGMSGNSGTSDLGAGLDAEPYMDNLLGVMRADTTWPTWCTDTAGNFTTRSVSTNNLAALITAGTISGTFWCDYIGWHAYGFSGRSGGGGAGTDNATHWLKSKAADTTAARFVRMLNNVHAHAVASNGDPNLDRIMFISTESGTPYHQLATTGVGADFTRVIAGVTVNNLNATTMSSPEAYRFLTVIRQLLSGVRPWPTGGEIPAKNFTGEPAKRWALINNQRIYTAPGSYSGAVSFQDQGIFSRLDEVDPGPPSIAGGTMKVAIARDRPGGANVPVGKSRPVINSGQWDDQHIGDGSDWIDAWWRPWQPLKITTASLAGATRTVAYTASVVATGGAGDRTYAATGFGSGTLAINAGTGAITGTPSGSAGTRSIDITVTNDVGGVAKKTLPLVVA